MHEEVGEKSGSIGDEECGEVHNHWHKKFSRGWEPFLAPGHCHKIVSLGRVLSFAQWQVAQGPYPLVALPSVWLQAQKGPALVGAFSGAWGTGASMWGKLQ